MKRNQNSKVASLNNDHIRITEAQAERFRKQRVRFARRLGAFIIISMIVFGTLTGVLISKNLTLKEKQAQKKEAIHHLAEVKEQQELLNTQIKKLEDDDYIAKLLRKEYFLSEKGEIIFIIPEEQNKDKN